MLRKWCVPVLIISMVCCGSLFAQPVIRGLSPVAGVTLESQDDRAVVLLVNLEDGASAKLRIDIVTEYMVRVRLDRAGAFDATLPEQDGFLKTDWSVAEFTVDETSNSVRIDASGVTVKVQKKPFGLAILQDGNTLTEMTQQGSILNGTEGTILSMASPEQEDFYGFCDQGSGSGAIGYGLWAPDRGPLLHRGQVLTMASLSFHRIYYSPFFMSTRGYGFFLNTLVRSHWDMARTQKDRYAIQFEDPRLDFFIIAGPSYKDILKRYTELIGRPPIPPKWVMGGRESATLYGIEKEGERLRYHNRQTWFNQKEIEQQAKNIREQKLSVEHFHLDAAWETDHNSFEWVPEIPDPPAMLNLLNRLNFKVSIWQRPTLADYGYAFYREGEEKGYLVKGADGKPHVSPYHFRGPSAMVDFTNPDAVRWWQAKVKWLAKLGAKAYKLDSGSSGFTDNYAEGLDLQFHNGLTGKQMDNYYGPLYIKTVWEAQREAMGDERVALFIYHNTYFAGGRYPVSSLGDRGNAPVECKIRYALNYGMSGVPFWNGAMYGAFRIPMLDNETNHRLQPYTYTYWREAHETGLPITRTLALEYQDDPETIGIDDQFLFGRDFLVAPSLEYLPEADDLSPAEQLLTGRDYLTTQLRKEGRRWRKLYLPEGEWVHYWSGQKLLGPGWMHSPAGAEKQPLFVRSGAIIPMRPVMEYTGQKPWDPLTLHVYPNGESEFTLYEDDFHTYGYERDEFARTRITCSESETGVSVTVGASQGQYVGKVQQRKYNFIVYGTTRPETVLVNGKPLPKAKSQPELENRDAGWFYKDRQYAREIHIRVPVQSTNADVRVEIDGAEPIRYYVY
jgi:alpha-glucosidase (family GH31 glycosyl hydrolase)